MFVDVEATGCPNACRHCSVDGRPPCGALYTLEELHGVRAEWGPLIYLHEPTAHPSYPELFDPALVDARYEGGLLPTSGFGIARRDDYAAQLQRLTELGFSALSFTLHGLREHHDWFVGRQGAFADIATATRRARELGLKTHWQIFVDRRGLDDVASVVELAVRQTGGPARIAVPFHRVSARLWRYEKLRPTLAEILQSGIHRLPNVSGSNELADPEALTAGSWLERWRASPRSDEYVAPFEPDGWPPQPPFEWLAIHIRRDRSVWLDPTCAEPIRLGCLQDGREMILNRLRAVRAPACANVDPSDVVLSPMEEEQVHPKGFSLRNKTIANAIRAAGSR